MKKKLLFVLIGIVGFAFATMASVQKSFKIDDQTGQFTARFTVVPNANGLNAAVGLGPVELTQWGDFNCIVAFGTNDTMVVRNGDSYGYDVPMRYSAGTRYLVQMDVDVAAKTYTVKISAPGEDPIILAQDYAFRENNYTGTISYLSTRIESANVDDYIGVANFSIGENTLSDGDQDIWNTAIPAQTGDFFTKFTAIPSHDNMNGLVGLSARKITTWGDYNAYLAFGGEGKIVARNADKFEAVNEIAYKGGQRYMFLVTGNTDTKTYNILCVSPDGSVDTVAWNYGFRNLEIGDGINNLSTHAVYNPGWGGLANTFIVVDGVETGVLQWDAENPVTSSKMEVQTGTFTKTYAVTPSISNLNAALAFSSKPSKSWGDLNAIVGFGTDGKLAVRNGGAYEADAEFFYKGLKTYLITLECDIANNTYDVTIQGPSPHDAPVKIADDYEFRSAPVDTLQYMVTKSQWNSYGLLGGYLTVAEVGITENAYNPDANQPPTIDPIGDITLGEDIETIDLTGITDGDDGTQTVTVTAESDNTEFVTVETENISGNDWKLYLTPVGSGAAVITVTVKDDGGTVGGGEDTKKISFTATVGQLGLELTVYKAVTKPTIDGFIDDDNDGWQEWQKVENVMSGTPKSYFSAEYSIMYDDEYFYVAGKCNDETAEEASTADHEWDHVEFYFHMSSTQAPAGAYKAGTWQMRGERQDLSAIFPNLEEGRWGGNNVIAPWDAAPMANAEGFKSGFVTEATKWSFECRLPRAKLLEGVDDFDGKHFRWDIYFVDNPGAISDISIINWNTEFGPKHLDMRSFGYAVMSDTPTAIDNEIEKQEGVVFIANDYLNIRNVEGRVRLYSVTGALMIDDVVHGSKRINVAHLKNGIYIVKGAKFTKKVFK